MEEKQQEDETLTENQRQQGEGLDLLDLALNMQVMSIADPRLSSVQANQLQQEEEVDFSFCLLMKIACTGGTTRIITKQVLQQSMAKAWRNYYYAISQVSDSVFLAHFRSQEAMMSIYTRQPWTVGSDNLLLDWFDPLDEAKSSADYKFEYIFVTIRAYGIPRAARSIALLADILNQIGAVSEYHILQQNMLFAKQDYIWGTAKMRVDQPVKDRIQVIYPDNNSGLTYLHYEKIKRICLFCGIMFHNAQHCPLRTNILRERSKKGLSVHEVPAQRYGQWVIEEDLVPLEAIRSASITNVGLQPRSNPILDRLQKLFADDPKGKMKQLEQVQQTQTSVHEQASQVPVAAPFSTHQSQASKRSAPNEDLGAALLKKSTLLPSCYVPISQQGSLNQVSTGEGQARLLPVVGQSQEQIDAKQHAPNQLVATDKPQSPPRAHRAIYPADIGGSRAEANALRIDAATIADSTETTNERAIRDVDAAEAERKIRRRPRGWDVPPPAVTGEPIRNPRRHCSTSVRGEGYPYARSPCRQIPRRSRTSTTEHDPWTIRTPLPIWSPGTSDSRQEAFSPPQMVDSYYVSMDVGNLAFGQKVQGHDGEEGQSSAIHPNEGVHLQRDHGDYNEDMEMNQGAMAPAHEAPRAP